MGSLSGQYISQSFTSLIHLGSNTTIDNNFVELEDGLGNGLNVSVNALGDISASGNIYAANLNALTSSALITASATSNVITFTKGNGSTFNVTVADTTDLSSLNAFTSSQNTKNNTLSVYTASVDNSLSSLNSFTSSQNTKNATLASYTGSNDTKWSNLGAQSGSWITESETGSFVTTSSFNQYTSSNDDKVNQLINATGSYAISSSVAAVDAAQQLQINSLINATASYANSASVATVDYNQQQQINSLIAATASFQTSSTDITSLNAFTASQETKNSTLATYTASVNSDLSALHTFTASQETKDTTLANVTSSLNQFTQSQANLNLTFATTGSNTFNGDQIINGNISAVSGTFQYIHTIFETASVIYSSGSNQLGDELTDIQTLSGSVRVQGSLTVNGTPVQTSSVDISSLNQFTASQDTKNSTLATYTQSVDSSLNNINQFTASAQSQLTNLINATASYAISSSVAAVDAAQQAQIDNLISWTSSVVPTDISSLNQFTASQETKNSTLAGYTASVDVSLSNINSFTSSATTQLNNLSTSQSIDNTKWSNLSGQSGSWVSSNITASSLVTASVNLNTITFTKGDSSTFNITVDTGSGAPQIPLTSLNAFTASQETKNSTLASYTASVDISLSNINSFTSSQETKNSTLATYTASVDTKFSNIGAQSGSWITESETGSFAKLDANQTFTGINTFTNDITASQAKFLSIQTGTLTATTIHTITESSSVIYSSGSNIFGDAANDTQTLYGSTNVVNELTASGLHYPTADNGQFSFIQTDGNGNLSLQYVNTVNDTIYNAEATQILRGTPLFVSGATGANPNVYRADASNPLRMPVTYVAGDNINAASTGRGIILGQIDAVNTTGYPEGSEIYVAEGGGWTLNRPSGSSSVVQLLGVVTKEGSGGKGLVLNPGPATLPNLQTGYAWVGNGDNQPVAVATSSFIENLSGYTTTASFNAYTSSNDAKVNSLINATASYADSASVALVDANQQLQINSLINATGSYVTSAITASSLITASVSLNTITFTKGDASTFNITVDTGSAITTDLTSLNAFTASQYVSNSFFATTGSNTFNGNQNIVGTLRVSNSTEISSSLLVTGSLQVIGFSAFTGSISVSSSATYDIDVNGAVRVFGANPTLLVSSSASTGTVASTALAFSSSATLNTATYGRNVMRQNSGSNAMGMSANPGQGNWVAGVTEPSIITFSGSAAVGNYYAPIRFQPGDQYTDGRVTFKTPVVLEQALTASLTEGYTWVGGVGNITKLVATSSFGGGTINTGSFATTGSNAFFGTNSFSGALQITGSAPTILSSSYNGTLITNLTDTYTDVPEVNQIVTLTSASYAALTTGSLINQNTLYIVSGSASNNYATTGSNSFVGSQTISGSLTITGSAYGNVVSMSITSNTASMDLSQGNYFTLSLPSGSTTRISPTGIAAGVGATLVITTLSGSLVTFDSSVKQPSGSAYVPSSGSTDILSFVSVNTTNLYVVASKNMI